MKSSINLSMLLLTISLITQPIFAESRTERNDRSCLSSLCSEKESCKSFINITEHDINKASKHSTQGLVLDHPGTYKLCEDVNWKVKAPNSYAITIAANNVSLDLDGHFIKQLDISLANNYAIQVTGDASYTLIHNGVLQQISGGGIIVQGGADGVTIDKIDCNRCSYAGALDSDIFPIPFLSAITLFGTGAAGIENAVITNCKITDNGIVGTEPVWFQGTIAGTTLTLTNPPLYPITPGFELRLSDGTTSVGVVIATIVTQLTPTTFTITPTAPIAIPTNMTVTDPNGAFVPAFPFLSFVGPTFTGYTFAIGAIGASNVTVANNIVDKSFGFTASYALTFIGDSAVVAANNIVNNLTTFGLTKGLFGVFATDFLIEDLVVSNLICNAIPLFTGSSIGHGAEGTKLSGVSNTILRRASYDGCTVQTEIATTLTNPTGYYDCVGMITDFFVSDLLVEDCSAINMNNDGGQVATNPSYTAGFNAATFFGDIERLHYTGCKASNINASVGWAWGLGCNPGAQAFGVASNVTYINSTVQDVSVFGDGIYAAGFLVNGNIGQVVGCSASRILGDAAFGIILDTIPSGQANHCIIANNRVSHCDTLGIFDNTVPFALSKNIFNSNYAYLNGLGGNVNYSINTLVNPIRVWKTTGAPDPVDQFGILDPSLDNLDIRNS